jgi:formylglycine-generating enzyme required for sulfatase activity
VTNQQYERMIPGHGKLREEYSNADDQPVIYVNWFEARLFCRWRGTGFRLPAEEKWYRAAAGEDIREYRWGNEFDLSQCNTREGGPKKTTPVAAYHDGLSATQSGLRHERPSGPIPKWEERLPCQRFRSLCLTRFTLP